MNKLNFTICIPCRNRINFCNQALAYCLKNSNYNIIVIDDNSENPDDEFIKHERIKIIYNKEKRGLTNLWCQLIKEASTEHLIICGDKLRLKKTDFELIENKLKEGFALVGTYMMGCIGFSKHLTTVIGFPDTGFKYSGFEDTDFLNKLFVNNLGLYISTESHYIQCGSNWQSNLYNETYYKTKWIEDWENKQIIQLREDENKEDINFYKNQFEERQYLTFDKSELLCDNIKNYYKDKTGYKQFQLNK